MVHVTSCGKGGCCDSRPIPAGARGCRAGGELAGGRGAPADPLVDVGRPDLDLRSDRRARATPDSPVRSNVKWKWVGIDGGTTSGGPNVLASIRVYPPHSFSAAKLSKYLLSFSSLTWIFSTSRPTQSQMRKSEMRSLRQWVPQ